ncbi:MAG TPA: ornithine cyclodeaminase family protein [Rhizobiales bacterium]|nr:ornithine cyclodeaminase family protein [Hyphomicrobiales bacterium]
MHVLSADDVNGLMQYPALVEALRSAFQGEITTPVRHHHTIEMPDQSDATLLLMPAWHDAMAKGHSNNGYVGIKMVSVYPDNAQRAQKPSILGTYLLLDGATGEIRAIMDGPAITVWRTACASALAASYLAHENAEELLMVGTGALSEHLVRAHLAVRPLKRIRVWGRNPAKAEHLVTSMGNIDRDIDVVEDLAEAATKADVISCATMASDPLIMGEWLKPGAHLDLVGAYRPDMRESDDEAIRRANVFCDTKAGATKEGGDLVQPLADGILTLDQIKGDLFELCKGEVKGRVTDDEITLFKSVGTAIEDLAAAQYLYELSH